MENLTHKISVQILDKFKATRKNNFLVEDVRQKNISSLI